MAINRTIGITTGLCAAFSAAVVSITEFIINYPYPYLSSKLIFLVFIAAFLGGYICSPLFGKKGKKGLFLNLLGTILIMMMQTPLVIFILFIVEIGFYGVSDTDYMELLYPLSPIVSFVYVLSHIYLLTALVICIVYMHFITRKVRDAVEG